MEKKHVVFDLRISYNGPLSIVEFYAEVEKWMDEKGLQKDLKRKSEDVSSKGKKIEWIIEAWNEATHLVKQTVRLRALFTNVKELKLKRKGRTVRINQVEALMVIDGFMETKLGKQWTMNPLYHFLRVMLDKYIWNIGMTETERFEGAVYDNSYDLHKRLKAFFDLSKMKVK